MFDIKKILEQLNINYKSNFNLEKIIISRLVLLNDSSEGGLGFIDSSRSDKEYMLEHAKAHTIICDDSLKHTDKRLIYVDNPKLVFSKLGNHILFKGLKHNVDKTAVIHPEAIINKPVQIGRNVTIGKCKIGSGTKIRDGARILDNTEIGKNVIIYCGAIVGETGFGYNRTVDDTLIQFPHVGGVIIEDFVEIGANSCIDRGSLGNTIIGFMSKIDNLVHIGHNVRIGNAVMVAAKTSIAGSSIIGSNTNIWTSVSVADNIEIGENCEIGIGSVVISSISNSKKCFGNPARVYV